MEIINILDYIRVHMEAGNKKIRRRIVIFAILSVSIMLSGFCLVDSVTAANTTKFYSTFESVSDEPDWTRARTDGDINHPYMSNGLLTTSRSGIYRSAPWLPHNYTYQCSFFISSINSEYNDGLATLLSVYQNTISSGMFEVQVQVSNSAPRIYVSGYASNALTYDHTYIFNMTVSNNRTCTASVWSSTTGLNVICTDSHNPASCVVYPNYQYIFIGSLTMQSGSAKAHNLFFNFVKLDYWSGWDSPPVTGYDNSSWSDIDANLGVSVKLIVFFIPILILAWSFGKPGFLLGSGLMSIIWVFNDASFMWASIMMFASIGVFAYRGGLE